NPHESPLIHAFYAYISSPPRRPPPRSPSPPRPARPLPRKLCRTHPLVPISHRPPPSLPRATFPHEASPKIPRAAPSAGIIAPMSREQTSKQCMSCLGSGEAATDYGVVDCPDCGGAGTLPPRNVRIEWRAADIERALEAGRPIEPE